MKSKFLSTLFGGGQIIFCSLLINVNTLNSQDTVLITGKSQFRNYSFEVKNHCFEIHNMYGTSFPFTHSSADYCSSSCITTYYDYLALSNNQNSNDNNISITPSSDNDLADYQNGVSSLDKVKIYYHANGSQYITDPFKMVAADVNMDGQIDSTDGDMVDDLILEDIPFTRNSWEWFNSEDIYDNWGSFTSDPYSWTLSYNGGSIAFLNVSTSLLSNSTTQPRYFYFNTTKVGDIDTNSTKNDWVCGAYGFGPKKNKLESISNNYPNNTWEVNENFDLNLSLNETDSLCYFQLPLNVDFNSLKIEQVIINSKLPIEYKSKLNRNKFIALFASKSREQNQLCSKGESLLTLKFKVIKPINDLQKVLSIDNTMITEAGNGNFEDLELIGSIELPITAIINNMISIEKNNLKLNHSDPVYIEIRYIDIVGHIVFSKKQFLMPGDNFVDMPNSIGGLLIGQVVSKFGSVQYYTRN